MATTPGGSNHPREAGDSNMVATYVTVLVVWAVVLVVLYAFQRYFTH